MLFIGCFVAAGLNEKFTTSKVQQTPISLFVAPLSVTEIDLKSYGIDVNKNEGIKITASYNPDVQYTGNIDAAFQNGDIDCTTKLFEIPNAPYSHNNILVRYWPHGQVPRGTIKCSTNDNYLYIWSGSLRNLTSFNCNSEDLSKQLKFSCSQDTLDVPIIAKKVQANAREDEDLVAMLFCSENESYVTVSINIVECLSLPTNTYTKMKVNGHTIPTTNFMIVNFNDDIFAKHPKVYIDTEGLTNFQNNYDKIEIQMTGIRNEIYWKILVGIGFFSILVIVILFCICILLCCCYRKKVNN